VTRKSTLRKRTERFADQNMASARNAAKSGRKAAKSGWNDLTDRLESVADRTQNIAGDTKSRLIDIEREGLRRGKNAKDALAGRPPKRRGGWFAGAAALGVGVGALVTVMGRKLAQARERMQAEQAATAVANDLRMAELRDDLARREAGPLTDPELDTLGLGTGTNGAIPAKAATPRMPATKPAGSTTSNGLGTQGSTPESRKPTS
jgi:hypothetical protein